MSLMRWGANLPATTVFCAPEFLTSKLNYVWLEPGKPVPPVEPPFWILPDKNEIANLVESLAESQWRTDYIRQEIIRLKLKPKGVRRSDLLRQLLEGFLDPERFSRQFATLNDEEQRYYLYLLLYDNLTVLRTQPTPLDQIATFSRPSRMLMERILDAGLGLKDEEGQFFVPYEMFKLLPPVYLPFDTEPPPPTFTPAADPRLLLTKIQQLLGLVQAGHYHLRPRPRWRMPRTAYLYSNESPIWPPAPDDAQRLLNDPNRQGMITLCPSPPYLDERTIAAWSANLDLAPADVECLYHVLIQARLLLPGEPVTLNSALLQAWMTQTPDRQLTTVYQTYRNLADWADWWSAWRAGDIKVQWNYQNYWTLTAIDQSLKTAFYLLRWIILDGLAYLPHDVWLSVEKVAQFFTRLYPEPKTHSYLQNLLCKDAQDHWKGFLGQVLRAMLRGMLYTFGFVEAAPDLANIQFFRLRRLQSLHWNRAAAWGIEATTRFSCDDVAFRPREQALAIKPPAKAEFLIAVQRWSEPLGLVDNQLRYRLDASRLHRAFEQGETPETLAAAWEQHAGFPPLPDVQRWWEYWWERYGHIRLYTGQTTLVTRDEFTMQELQVALPTLHQGIMGLLTPRVALLQPEQVNRILSDLERQGYMPKEEA